MSALGISIALDDGPFVVDPTWTRIDDPDDIKAVQTWDTDRGKASESEKTKTGTATLQLIDKTGIFDPTSSAFQMDPGLQAQLSLFNPVTETWSMIYRGYVADWFGSWDTSQKFQVVTLNLEDAFGLIARMEMTPGHHGYTAPAESLGDIYFQPQQVNDRLIKILDDIGWPGTGTGINTSHLRNIFSGNVALQGAIYARRDSALNAMFDCADAEWPNVANLFTGKTGIITFHGRFARFNPDDYTTFGITRWKAGDRATVLGDDTYAIISGLDWRRSNQDIVNASGAWPMNVSETDVPGNVVVDTGSIAARGWYSDSFDDLLTLRGDEVGGNLTAVQEVKQYAQYQVDNFASPRTRITTLRFRPRQVGRVGDAALWEFMCGLELSDVIDVLTFPNQPGGGGFNEPYFVEGIRYSAAPMKSNMPDITMEIDLSPAAWYDTSPFS